MSGRINKDGHFQSLTNGSRRIIDGEGNVSARTLTVTGTDGILANCIAEKTTGNGIRVKSDVNLDSGLILRSNCLEQRDGFNNGIRIKSNVNLDSGVSLSTNSIEQADTLIRKANSEAENAPIDACAQTGECSTDRWRPLTAPVEHAVRRDNCALHRHKT